MCLQRLSPFLRPQELIELIETRTYKTSPVFCVFCVPRKHHQDPEALTHNPSSTLVDRVDKAKPSSFSHPDVHSPVLHKVLVLATILFNTQLLEQYGGPLMGRRTWPQLLRFSTT